LGALARSLEVFRKHMLEGRRLASQKEEDRARAETEKRAALTSMADRIETESAAALGQLRLRTAAMTSTADLMTASAERTGAAAETAASAAGQAMANAQTVAGAAEQLTASIREIGLQMGQSTEVVSRAVTAGVETRATIEALNQEVERIGAVAIMIRDIAAKTNLLALNATIEAARAGDAGKGFAVVASEVKALATQTARSTEDISRHIGQVRQATGASVAAVARIEQTITEVNAIARSIAEAVEQQGAATAEIARNIGATASAANEMTARTTDVSAEAGETGRQAGEVRENALGLETAMNDLRQAVIRIVRTSTTEVDRRGRTRHAIDLACRLMVNGQSCTVHTTELSETGAEVRGAPALAAGGRGTLAIEGVGFSLPIIVRRSEDDIVGLEFTLDSASAAKFAETLAGLVQARAA
jgi:methyl-accepting chemotaxis protein